MANHARVDLVDQLIPSRLVDREDRDAVHDHLLSVGWEADGTQYRWGGAGKRTWTRALAEQVGREVEEAAETIAVCDDPELVAAAAAEPERRLREAALSSRFVTEAMVRAAVNDGLHVEAAGAAVVPDDVVGLLVGHGVSRGDRKERGGQRLKDDHSHGRKLFDPRRQASARPEPGRLRRAGARG